MLESLRYTIDTSMVNRNLAVSNDITRYRVGFAGQIAAEMQRLANITTPGVDIRLKNNLHAISNEHMMRYFIYIVYLNMASRYRAARYDALFE